MRGEPLKTGQLTVNSSPLRRTNPFCIRQSASSTSASGYSAEQDQGDVAETIHFESARSLSYVKKEKLIGFLNNMMIKSVTAISEIQTQVGSIESDESLDDAVDLAKPALKKLLLVMRAKFKSCCDAAENGFSELSRNIEGQHEQGHVKDRDQIWPFQTMDAVRVSLCNLDPSGKATYGKGANLILSASIETKKKSEEGKTRGRTSRSRGGRVMSSARRKKALCYVYGGEHKILDSNECQEKRIAFQSAIEKGTLESFKATTITSEPGKALQNKSLAGKSIRNINSEYWSPPPDTGGL